MRFLWGCECLLKPFVCFDPALTKSQRVYGTRHKCRECPDFDLCGQCIDIPGIHKHNAFKAIGSTYGKRR